MDTTTPPSSTESRESPLPYGRNDLPFPSSPVAMVDSSICWLARDIAVGMLSIWEETIDQEELAHRISLYSGYLSGTTRPNRSVVVDITHNLAHHKKWKLEKIKKLANLCGFIVEESDNVHGFSIVKPGMHFAQRIVDTLWTHECRQGPLEVNYFLYNQLLAGKKEHSLQEARKDIINLYHNCGEDNWERSEIDLLAKVWGYTIIPDPRHAANINVIE